MNNEIKKWAIILGIVLVVIGMGFFLYYFALGDKKQDIFDKPDSSFQPILLEENLNESQNNSVKNISSDTGGRGGSRGGESQPPQDQVDILAEECGFYFQEYGVCGGTCPSGVCVSTERSCYCQS